MKENKNIILDKFHNFYWDSEVWMNTFWFGTQIRKYPSDLFIYQEILYETKPDIIIECGTANGGSALYLANIFDLIGKGQIITIDVKDIPRPQHKRITYLIGSSISKEIIEKVKSLITNKNKIMVILDSNHMKEHVLKELEAYSELVTKGCYLIIEDTNINGHPVKHDFGPGPMEALKEFIKNNNNFLIDKKREKFHITFNPNGYLKRI